MTRWVPTKREEKYGVGEDRPGTAPACCSPARRRPPSFPPSPLLVAPGRDRAPREAAAAMGSGAAGYPRGGSGGCSPDLRGLGRESLEVVWKPPLERLKSCFFLLFISIFFPSATLLGWKRALSYS